MSLRKLIEAVDASVSNGKSQTKGLASHSMRKSARAEARGHPRFNDQSIPQLSARIKRNHHPRGRRPNEQI